MLVEEASEQSLAEQPHLEILNTSRGDWVRIALEQPFNAEPGALWQYNSGGVIALGAAVASATGGPFYAYARERLFSPLGSAASTGSSRATTPRSTRAAGSTSARSSSRSSATSC